MSVQDNRQKTLQKLLEDAMNLLFPKATTETWILNMGQKGTAETFQEIYHHLLPPPPINGCPLRIAISQYQLINLIFFPPIFYFFLL